MVSKTLFQVLMQKAVILIPSGISLNFIKRVIGEAGDGSRGSKRTVPSSLLLMHVKYFHFVQRVAPAGGAFDSLHADVTGLCSWEVDFVGTAIAI